MASHRYMGVGEAISDRHIRICTFGGSRTEPAEYTELIRCPWCDEWHSADDAICPAWPAEPPVDHITEDDLDDWHDWIGGAVA